MAQFPTHEKAFKNVEEKNVITIWRRSRRTMFTLLSSFLSEEQTTDGEREQFNDGEMFGLSLN